MVQAPLFINHFSMKNLPFHSYPISGISFYYLETLHCISSYPIYHGPWCEWKLLQMLYVKTFRKCLISIGLGKKAEKANDSEKMGWLIRKYLLQSRPSGWPNIDRYPRRGLSVNQVICIPFHIAYMTLLQYLINDNNEEE